MRDSQTTSPIQLPPSILHSLSFIFRAIRRYAPLIVLDALLVAFSFYLALPMRFAGAPPDRYLEVLQGAIVFIVPIYCLSNYFFRLYHRLWRYASAQEVASIGESVVVSTLLVLVVDLFWPGIRPLPASTIFLGGFFALAGFTATRYRWRLVTGFLHRWRALLGGPPFPPILGGQGGRGTARARVLIVGAGEAGQLLAWRFQNQREGEGYELVGFVDDDPEKHGMRVHGIPVLGDRHAIPQLVARHQVDLVIIAIYNISGDDFQAILDLCEQSSAIIKVLPNVFDFIQGTNGLPPIRDVSTADLLGRKPVEIDRAACRDLLAGKTVLVTGAAGSIGSELCRQIIPFAPRQLLMLDNNESGLHDLVTTDFTDYTDENKSVKSVQSVVGDVTNAAKMRAVFETYHPQIVFHAAAYKHVPLMEEHPDEAVRVNVLGTRIVADLAAQYGAERFVLVSTDKAVNPCSVMGATKRLCEMMIANQRISESANGPDEKSEIRNPKSEILYTAVRFGNVLGSRGSVVPTFERQIEQGGPVTVTHPEMTRYFMSVSEAVSLIIQAAALTQGGDIFMLDMGQRIRIDDLARWLIRLRGLRPTVVPRSAGAEEPGSRGAGEQGSGGAGENAPLHPGTSAPLHRRHLRTGDIPIVYTGVRPGEKLHEELLGDGEEREPTAHPHIFRVRSKVKSGKGKMENVLEELIALAEAQRNGELVRRLWEVVGNSGAGERRSR